MVQGVVLIGMPGAGKSTVGVLLAKALGMGFEDTDILIQTRFACSLQTILEQHGYLELRVREEQVLLSVDAHRKVIATGGSAVYSATGMAHLRSQALVVYLDVPLPVLLGRLNNLGSRGLACPPGQSLAEMFIERTALYRRYADIHIAADLPSADAVVELIVAELGKLRAGS